MIKLNDILKLNNLNDYKIRFSEEIDKNKKIKEYAISAYFNEFERYKQACAWNGKNKQLNRPFLITFAKINHKEDLWLFTGVYKVLDYKEKQKTSEEILEISRIEEVEDYHNFCGRLVVKFHKTTQTYVFKAEKIIQDLEMNQILDEEYNNEYFKGYNNVDLTFKQLKHICKRQDDSWKTALENSKGVYLIRDDKTGKMYVGSAYSKDMLWSRWNDYARNAHGGNKELKIVVENHGRQYIEEHFHFSILEHFISSVDDKTIIERESYWKEILQTRKFGYNDN